jgi:hypothetical protein
MTRAKYIAAAVVLSSLIASPVLAQNMSQDAAYRTSHRSDRIYDGNHERHDSGFWPADVAAGVVDGAVGAAGAIATAPFQDNDYAYTDAYAYDNDGAYPSDDGYRYYMNDGQKEAMSAGSRYNNPYSYAARNSFVCQPGTWTRMEDGQQHLCQ